MTPGTSSETKAKEIFEKVLESSGMAKFIETYNVGTTIFLSLATVAVLIVLILNIIRLGSSQGNPMRKNQAYHGILVSGLCFAFLCGFDLIYAIVLNFVLS